MVKTHSSQTAMTIDRIEGDLAVCEKENGSFVNVPLKSLPSGAREGSVLVRDGSSWRLDAAREAQRRGHIAKKMNSLFK